MGDVRRRLQEMTNVQPKRQKLIGLGKKPNPGDDIPLGSLHLKNPHSFMMVLFLRHFAVACTKQRKGIYSAVTVVRWAAPTKKCCSTRLKLAISLRLSTTWTGTLILPRLTRFVPTPAIAKHLGGM